MQAAFEPLPWHGVRAWRGRGGWRALHACTHACPPGRRRVEPVMENTSNRAPVALRDYLMRLRLGLAALGIKAPSAARWACGNGDHHSRCRTHTVNRIEMSHSKQDEQCWEQACACSRTPAGDL